MKKKFLQKQPEFMIKRHSLESDPQSDLLTESDMIVHRHSLRLQGRFYKNSDFERKKTRDTLEKEETTESQAIHEEKREILKKKIKKSDRKSHLRFDEPVIRKKDLLSPRKEGKDPKPKNLTKKNPKKSKTMTKPNFKNKERKNRKNLKRSRSRKKRSLRPQKSDYLPSRLQKAPQNQEKPAQPNGTPKNLGFVTFRSRSQKQKSKNQIDKSKKPIPSKESSRFEDSIANLKELDLGFSKEILGKANGKNKTYKAEKLAQINFENEILSNLDEHEHDSEKCGENCAEKIRKFRKFILKLKEGRRLSRTELLKIYDHVFKL